MSDQNENLFGVNIIYVQYIETPEKLIIIRS